MSASLTDTGGSSAHVPKQQTIKFNVGGKSYEVSRSLIEKHGKPETMLARLVSDTWQEDQNAVIFVDRDGEHFRHVLNYLRYGRISLPQIVSKDAFLQDMEYYGIDIADGTVDYECYAAQAMELNKEMIEIMKTQNNKINSHNNTIVNSLNNQTRAISEIENTLVNLLEASFGRDGHVTVPLNRETRAIKEIMRKHRN